MLNRIRQRDGFSLVYATVGLVLLCSFVSLGVDLGRVQIAKTELQVAADAAVCAAAAGLTSGGASQARANAIAVAGQNKVDGSPLTLTNADIEVGNWNNGSFTPNGSPTNAVRVNASRTAAAGNAVPLLFAQVIGRTTCDVRASAIAKTNDITSGFIGLDSVTVKNNLFAASFNANIDTNPGQSSHLSNGMLGSNGAITAKNNEVIGSVFLGPSGSHNLDLTVPATVLSQSIPTPAIDFSGAPVSNPGGVSQNLSVNGTTTLAGGTYHFTSIALGNNAKLTFSGPATVYVTGNVSFSQNGDIVAHNDIPSNLKIRQRGASSEFGGSNANKVLIIADVEGPQTALHAKNSLEFRGRGVFKSIDAKNNADFYYDEALQATISGMSGGSVVTVR